MTQTEIKKCIRALESLDAILCGELSNDWSDLFGVDFEMYMEAKEILEKQLSGD
jgi:hypothetical protein